MLWYVISRNNTHLIGNNPKIDRRHPNHYTHVRYGPRPLGQSLRYRPHVDFLIIYTGTFLPGVIRFDTASKLE